MKTYTSQHEMAVGIAMRQQAELYEVEAAKVGTSLKVVTAVYTDDGTASYATALAQFLVDNPEHAEGTRDDMAGIVTRQLGLTKPFPPSRMSRDLTRKQRDLVRKLLEPHGYPTGAIVTALHIRDAVRLGKASISAVAVTMETKFEVHQVTMNGKTYPYTLVDSATALPWYRLGIRYAGRNIALHEVLAIRSIGIGQFRNMDEQAYRAAGAEALATRTALMVQA
ncbi:hypothetical protein M3I54_23725 [Paraburkholderia sp. CNPSo 3274]|uniref:hypothetical protein n=1 Tax=Paraburkholderia sp. CNPSo 3274 TaxID=2940932 RepID=UPI0020B8C577|nr:hypothetical protein [Paraburkholderia sp. CNPSo 3274]MCP3709953.1 hypothetical protein [Paraburkholderia sp. CNPSo 3274]